MTDRRIEEMCAAAHELSGLGLTPGSSGNISVRQGHRIYMSPSGTPLGTITPESVSTLELRQGRGAEHLSGPKPSKEVGLHESLYRTHYNGTCVIHLHSTNAVAASLLQPWSEFSSLPPLTPYFVMRVGQVPLMRYAVPGSDDLVVALEEIQVPFKAALMRSHGSIVIGGSVAEAIDRAVELEEAAKIRMLLAGQPDLVYLSDGEARELADQYEQLWGVTTPTQDLFQT